jgi:Thioredoxin
MDTGGRSRFHAASTGLASVVEGRATKREKPHRIAQMGQTLVCAALLCGTLGLSARFAAREAIDYSALYAKGVTFAAFLDAATEHPDDWRSRYSNAAVDADTVSRLRALPARRRLLVVAEDYCSDSTATVPYVARLVDAAPDRLEMRVIDSRTGRAVMEAHRTPDGRAATPTVVVLTGDGNLVGAWTERPSVLQAWVVEHRPTRTRRELHDYMATWYAGDAGRSAVTEILALIER